MVTVVVVKYATPKNLVFKVKMFPHRNIHMYIWNSADAKNRNHIENVLINRRRYSRIHSVRYFRELIAIRIIIR
jgi:hypothetical protein